MAENKMEHVADMFGKKLGEEFEVKWEGIDGKMYHEIYHFSKFGLIEGRYGGNAGMLAALLTGEAEIVEG